MINIINFLEEPRNYLLQLQDKHDVQVPYRLAIMLLLFDREKAIVPIPCFDCPTFCFALFRLTVPIIHHDSGNFLNNSLKPLVVTIGNYLISNMHVFSTR